MMYQTWASNGAVIRDDGRLIIPAIQLRMSFKITVISFLIVKENTNNMEP